MTTDRRRPHPSTMGTSWVVIRAARDAELICLCGSAAYRPRDRFTADRAVPVEEGRLLVLPLHPLIRRSESSASTALGHTHTHTGTHADTHTHTHTHTDTGTQTRTHSQTHTNAHKRAHTQTHKNTHGHTCICTHRYAHMHNPQQNRAPDIMDCNWNIDQGV